MPAKTITIPTIKGLESSLTDALTRRNLSLANLNDDFFSVQAFEALQHYLTELITKYKHPEQHLNTLAVLIASKAAKLHEEDLKLSTINRQTTLANAQASQATTVTPSLGSYLADGGDIATFGGNGWADESLPTIMADLLASNKNIAVIGPLASLAMAKTLATRVLNTDPDKTDVMSFVRTGGNHWQLSHTEKTADANLKTTVHNPQGDGACGYRAAAKCLSILKEKHKIHLLGTPSIISWDAPKQAVEQQAVALYRQVAILTATVTPEQVVKPQQARVEKPILPFKVAAEELESTGVMLSALQGVEKLSAVLKSQEKELAYWAQVKADRAFAESLEKQENSRFNDKAMATGPQTSTPADQLKSDAALARRLQAEEFKLANAKKPETSCKQEADTDKATPAATPRRLIR